jgi:drug/metabolite transporter (DMT)-like permease
MRASKGSAELLDLPRAGILFVMGAIALLSVQDAIIKWISGDYPVHELVFIRSPVALLLLLPIIYFEGGLSSLRSGQYRLQFLRGGLMFLASTFFFMGIAALPLADVVALTFVSPLFVAVLSVLFLGEKVGPRRWLAILVGFAGVVIMLRPGSGVFDPAGLLAIGTALCLAATSVITRRLGRTDSGSSIAFYTTLFYLISSALVGLAIGHGRLAGEGHASLQFLLRRWVVPSWTDLFLLLFVGVVGGLSFYLMSQAYRVTRATVVVPFEYIAVPLSVLWGYLIWKELPGPHTVAGIALVVGSGLYVLWRESGPVPVAATAGETGA